MAQIEWAAAIQNLTEMFPNHPPSLLERVLREHRGVLEPAISALLEIPPPKSSSSSRRPPSRPPPQQPHRSPPAAPAAPAPARPPQPDHIFPPDFLRWPKDVEWIRVRTDGGGASPLQTDDDVIQGASGSDLRDLLAVVPNEALARRSSAPEAAESGWSKLKSRFSGSTANYTPL
jgi:hypothetical protein